MTAPNPRDPSGGNAKQREFSFPLLSVEEVETKPVAVTIVQEKVMDPIITSCESDPQHTLHHTELTHNAGSTTQEDYDPHIGAKPYSPFYRHATPSSKLSRLTSQRKRSRSVGMVTSPIDDVEGGAPPWRRLYDDEATNTREPKLWVQEKRLCDCLGGLSKRQRMVVKIAIAVLILGSMVAIALGITAAVDGGVWSGDRQQERIG
ncbi:hypothetical protein BJX63DRAFT_378032 [Aspergillus granulosus]|uniref:Uncharacterized protein n=1 Tax=Aspergillus granulosus TaxID=176169 RepID=A0ABR4I3B0_9EURO